VGRWDRARSDFRPGDDTYRFLYETLLYKALASSPDIQLPSAPRVALPTLCVAVAGDPSTSCGSTNFHDFFAAIATREEIVDLA
jgi:hypothetical protein